jgi:hypothetical protein
LTRDASDDTVVSIRIDINLDRPTRIVCQQRRQVDFRSKTDLENKSSAEAPASIAISTPVLPSLLVTFRLAPEYPEQPHEVKTIRTWSTQGDSESWLPLSSEKRVREELKVRFEEDVERQGVLWSWVDWIASGAFLDADTEDITSEGGVYT